MRVELLGVWRDTGIDVVWAFAVKYGYRYYFPGMGKWLSNDPLMDPGSPAVMTAKRQLLKMLEVHARVAQALMFNEELPDDIRVIALFKLQEESGVF